MFQPRRGLHLALEPSTFSGDLIADRGRIFNATIRFMRRCSALNTCPMPPAPILSSTTYSPNTRFLAFPCTELAAWYRVSLPAWTSSWPGRLVGWSIGCRKILLKRRQFVGREQAAADDVLKRIV